MINFTLIISFAEIKILYHFYYACNIKAVRYTHILCEMRYVIIYTHKTVFRNINIIMVMVIIIIIISTTKSISNVISRYLKS